MVRIVRFMLSLFYHHKNIENNRKNQQVEIMVCIQIGCRLQCLWLGALRRFQEARETPADMHELFGFRLSGEWESGSSEAKPVLAGGSLTEPPRLTTKDPSAPVFSSGESGQWARQQGVGGRRWVRPGTLPTSQERLWA